MQGRSCPVRRCPAAGPGPGPLGAQGSKRNTGAEGSHRGRGPQQSPGAATDLWPLRPAPSAQLTVYRRLGRALWASWHACIPEPRRPSPKCPPAPALISPRTPSWFPTGTPAPPGPLAQQQGPGQPTWPEVPTDDCPLAGWPSPLGRDTEQPDMETQLQACRIMMNAPRTCSPCARPPAPSLAPAGCGAHGRGTGVGAEAEGSASLCPKEH